MQASGHHLSRKQKDMNYAGAARPRAYEPIPKWPGPAQAQAGSVGQRSAALLYGCLCMPKGIPKDHAWQRQVLSMKMYPGGGSRKVKPG